MVKLILATDMAKHKEILDELLSYVPNFDFKNKQHLESVSQFRKLFFYEFKISNQALKIKYLA